MLHRVQPVLPDRHIHPDALGLGEGGILGQRGVGGGRGLGDDGLFHRVSSHVGTGKRLHQVPAALLLPQLVGGCGGDGGDAVELDAHRRARAGIYLREGVLILFKLGGVADVGEGDALRVAVDQGHAQFHRDVGRADRRIEPVRPNRAFGAVPGGITDLDGEGAVLLDINGEFPEGFAVGERVAGGRPGGAAVKAALAQAALIQQIDGQGEAVGITGGVQRGGLRQDTAEVDLRRVSTGVRQDILVLGEGLDHAVEERGVRNGGHRDGVGLVERVGAQDDGGKAALTLAAGGGIGGSGVAGEVAGDRDRAVKVEVDLLRQGGKGEGKSLLVGAGQVAQVGHHRAGGVGTPVHHVLLEGPRAGRVGVRVQLHAGLAVPGEDVVVLEDVDAGTRLGDGVGDVGPGAGRHIGHPDDTAALGGGADDQESVGAGSAGAHVVVEDAQMLLGGLHGLTVELADRDDGIFPVGGGDGQAQAQGGAQGQSDLHRCDKEGEGLQLLKAAVVAGDVLVVEGGDLQALGGQGSNTGVAVDHRDLKIEAAGGGGLAVGILGDQEGAGHLAGVALLQVGAVRALQPQDALGPVVGDGESFNGGLVGDLKLAGGEIQRRIDGLLVVSIALLDLLHGPPGLIGKLEIGGRGVRAAAVGDLHADADPDLVALHADGGKAQILHGQLGLGFNGPGDTARSGQGAVGDGVLHAEGVLLALAGFGDGEVELPALQIFGQGAGVVVQTGGDGLAHGHARLIGENPLSQPLADGIIPVFIRLAGNPQLHGDGVACRAAQGHVAGILKGDGGLQHGSGGEVGLGKGDAALAHVLFAHAEG